MDKEIVEARSIEHWFLNDYLLRLLHIKRCKYLGIDPDESEYSLQVEAYKKEQRYRELKGKAPLQELKNIINL